MRKIQKPRGRRSCDGSDESQESVLKNHHSPTASRNVTSYFRTVCKQFFPLCRGYLFMILIMPAQSLLSNYSNTSGDATVPTTEQIRSVERRALYGATRGLVPKWLLQGSALPRDPSFFLSLFLRRRSTCSTLAIFMFLAPIMISRKIALSSLL